MEIEMDDLAAPSRQKYPPTVDTADGLSQSQSREVTADNTITIWAYAKAAWLALLSLPLLAFPRFLLFLSSTSDGEHRDSLTPLESFLSTHFGILLLSLAVTILTSVPPDAPVGFRRDSSHSHPFLFPITCGSLITAFLSYNTSRSLVGPLSSFVAIGAGGTGILGIWTLLFSGSSSRSSKTGADKRTSRFLFGNRSAASAQKVRWKKEHSANR